MQREKDKRRRFDR